MALPPASAQTSRGPRPSLAEAWRALLLISGNVTEDRFWSETWTSADRVLTQLTDWLRRSRAVRSIEIDEGWSDDRDVSVFVGRWAWLDVRALVEEHGGGKSLVRISTHLRPTTFGIVAALGIGGGAAGRRDVGRRDPAGAAAAALRNWRIAGTVVSSLTVALIVGVLWRTAQATAIVRRGIARVTLGTGMVRDAVEPGARAAHRAVAAAHLRPAQRVHLRADDRDARRQHVHAARGGDRSGHRRHARATPATTARPMEAWLDAPGGLAIAPNGDIYIADSNNDVIRRDRRRATA